MTEHQQQHRPGLTLLDSVLSLFVIAIMIVVFGTLVSTREVNRRTALRTQAAALADGELNALRRLQLSALPTQTNGPFMNIFYNAGNWTVATQNSAGHTTPSAVQLAGVSGLSNQVSGRLQFPAGAYANADIQAKWYIASDSPATWGIGYFFRMQDKNNGYRIRLGAISTDFDSVAAGNQNFVIEKLVNGTVTILDEKTNISFPTNTWQTLELVMDDTQPTRFKVYIGSTQQNTATISDTTYSSGKVAFLGWNGVHAYVDDAQTIVNGTTTSWNFDSDTSLPTAWVRLGLNDLPDTTPTTFEDNGLLTIQPFPNANTTSLKQVSITVRWNSNGTTASYTTTDLIGNSGLGQ